MLPDDGTAFPAGGCSISRTKLPFKEEKDLKRSRPVPGVLRFKSQVHRCDPGWAESYILQHDQADDSRQKPSCVHVRLWKCHRTVSPITFSVLSVHGHCCHSAGEVA